MVVTDGSLVLAEARAVFEAEFEVEAKPMLRAPSKRGRGRPRKDLSMKQLRLIVQLAAQGKSTRAIAREVSAARGADSAATVGERRRLMVSKSHVASVLSMVQALASAPRSRPGGVSP